MFEVVLYHSGMTVCVNYRFDYYSMQKAYEALRRGNCYIPVEYPQKIYLKTEAEGALSFDNTNNATSGINTAK